MKNQILKLDAGGKDVRIKRAITDLDRRRNWALNKADELVKADPRAARKKVEIKDRSVLVDGAVAYAQKERHDPSGQFDGEFANLKLP